MENRKTCPVCRKRLSAAAFNDSARSADGLARACRACTNARRRELSRKQRSESTASPPATGLQAKILASALRRGDIEAVRERMRSGTEVHWSWICETMREGHLALAEMLLASGIERNIFTMAAMGDSTGVKRRLRRRPADALLTALMQPDIDAVTPMHVACASNWSGFGPARMATQLDTVQALADHGADLHAKAYYRGLKDATPLFCACWSSRNLALVRWLLNAGANATDRDFLAALGHFQRKGREAYDIAELLLARGLPVDGGILGARTPLQAFAHQAVHKTVAWLLEHGANVNARGPNARTAAHFAAERNTGPRTLALLVAHGAELSARDDDGLTPLDTAKRNNKPRLVDWILTHTHTKLR